MFKGFSSIENSYREKTISLMKELRPDMQYVVMEKIHGANFSFWGDGKTLIAAKRSGPILDGEKFYNYKPVVEAYKDSIMALINNLVSKGHKEIGIFGELCGGAYPHPDVNFGGKEGMIQKEVKYFPYQNFVAFDVMADGQYLDYTEAISLLDAYDIPTAPMLFLGSLDEALAFKNDDQTVVPEIMDLPPIEGNIMEGTIIRPVTEFRLPNGDRAILKNKNEQFIEKKKTPKSKADQATQSDNLITAKAELGSYVNENRLKNVISKIGDVSIKDFSKLVRLLAEDAMRDFTVDNSAIINILSRDEHKLLNKALGNFSVQVIKEFVKYL